MMGITDGTVTCALCGEWRTTCGLCAGQERLTDRSAFLAKMERDEWKGERELDMQSRAIRDAKALKEITK